MKKTSKILTLACLLVLSINLSAKSQKGVYLTVSDYINNKVSYETNSKIRLNNSVLDLPYITVIDNGKKINLDKSEVYGFADRDNKAFRFYKNSEYQIVEKSKIIIYLQIEHIARSKGYNVKKNYYFSTSAGGGIIRLTVGNLKNAYRENEKFLDLIDLYFGNGDVAVFDNTHNTYKVNYVYARSLK